MGSSPPNRVEHKKIFKTTTESCVSQDFVHQQHERRILQLAFNQPSFFLCLTLILPFSKTIWREYSSQVAKLVSKQIMRERCSRAILFSKPPRTTASVVSTRLKRDWINFEEFRLKHFKNLGETTTPRPWFPNQKKNYLFSP